MARPLQEQEQELDPSVLAFRLASPCGRVFLVPLDKVREDYVQFLVDADGVDPGQARDAVRLEDLRSWFLEQFSWEDVDRMGVCERQATAPQVLAALNLARAQASPASAAELIVSAARLSARTEARLDQALPAPAPSEKPPPRM